MSEVLGILRTEELVDMLCELDRQKKEVDVKIKKYQGELQSRGLRVLEDRNIKYKEFYGQFGGRAEISYTEKLKTSFCYRIQLRQKIYRSFKSDFYQRLYL